MLSRGSECPVRGRPRSPVGSPFRRCLEGVSRSLIRPARRLGSSPPWIVAVEELRVRVANGARHPSRISSTNRAVFGGIWRGKRRYELSFSGGQNPLFWLIVGMITSEPGAAGSPRITQVPCWHIVIGSLPFQAVETAAPKKARSTIESRNKWVPQLHEPRPVRVGATCVVFRWPSEPTRGVASGVAALRSLHWQLRSYSGPETCGGHSIHGIVLVLPSSEAVTKAVGGRSAVAWKRRPEAVEEGLAMRSTSLHRWGESRGADRVMAWHQPFHRRQPTLSDPWFGVRDGVLGAHSGVADG